MSGNNSGKTIDADYELVSGPFREGDEHPDKPGWYWTGKKNRKGEWLWYKPPGPISRWVRRIGIVVYVGLFALAIIIGLLMGA